MKKLLLILCIVSLSFAAGPDWENPTIFERGQEPLHAPLAAYKSVEKALMDDIQQSEYYQSLNGQWKFKWQSKPEENPADFFDINGEYSTWDDINVPSNWQMQGYGDPMFRNVSQSFHSNAPFVPQDYNPVGSYFRTFTIPTDWDGRQVFLHFNGVKSASYFWVNGQKIGYNQGGMEGIEFNITPYLKAGENELFVKVLRYSDGTYLEDQDMWRLAGIYRDVYLYSTPQVHIRDFYITTDLDENYKDAQLNIEFDVRNYGKKTQERLFIRTKLFDGKKIIFDEKSSVKELGIVSFTKTVKNPKKWSAEKPNLYIATFELIDKNGNVLEILSDRVGFREIEIKDGAILVNGKVVKFNGVNSHMHHPETGRFIDRETMLQDLTLMKKFNINNVRTCHYPPDPMYLDLADEIGIWVVDETGDEAHSNIQLSYDEAFTAQYIDRAVKMVKQDRNHPSIIMWSAGNEAGSGPNIGKLIGAGKKLDNSRPGWMYGGNAGILPYEDIIGPRYPTHFYLRQLGEHPEIGDGRPSYMDEYDAATGNSLGGFDEYWDLIYQYRRLTGGAVWDWVSPGVLRDLLLVPDQSENNIPAHLMGKAELVDGKFGKALQLDGRDEWVEIYRDEKLNITGNQLTLECWVKPRACPDGNYFITKGSKQYSLHQTTDDSLEFMVFGNKPVSAKSAIPTNWYNEWHHVAGVYDGKELALFVDGNMTASTPCSGNINFDPWNVNVGRNAHTQGQDYPGQMAVADFDNIAVYDYAVSREKLESTFERNLEKSGDNPVYFLTLEETINAGEFYTFGVKGRAYGLVWPNREIQPELWQMKRTPQPVKIQLVDSEKGIVNITNRYNFTNLNELDAEWSLWIDGVKGSSNLFKVDVDPDQSQKVALPKFKVPETDGEVSVLVSFKLKEQTMWAPKGHEIAWEQFVIKSATKDVPVEKEKLVVSKTLDNISISGKTFSYTFDKKVGTLSSIKYSGNELLESGPVFQPWRAPIDNETDQWSTGIAHEWWAMGLDKTRFTVKGCEVVESENCVKIIVDGYTWAKTVGFDTDFIYTFYNSGDVVIENSVNPESFDRASLKWLPRVGLELALKKEYDQFAWYGRGPFETYPDRKTGAKIGVYSGAVAGQHVDYLVPQENGNKTDVRWAILSNKNGDGLYIESNELFNISVHDYTTENLDRALYPYQLKRGDVVTVNVDHKITGVGGTPITTLYEYRVFPQKYVYKVRLKPFNVDEQRPIDLYKQKLD